MLSQLEKRLLMAITVTFFILAGEVVGGLLSNSLALLSDAGHNLTDILALSLSLIASIITHQPAGKTATYGYHRMGVLAAIINGGILVAVALYIFIEAYHRIISPPEIRTGLMLAIAVIGLIGNLLAAWFVKDGHRDLNMKSAWLHLVYDTISSAGVIIAGIIIYYTGWRLADPIASVFVGIFVIVGGVSVLGEALRIFLELTPHGFDIEQISKEIAELPDILGIHDVHIWTIAPGTTALTAHLWVHEQGLGSAGKIRERIEHKLAHIGISHTVLQMECAECNNEGLYCQIQTGMPSPHEHHAH